METLVMLSRHFGVSAEVIDGNGSPTEKFKLGDPGGGVKYKVHNLTFYPATFELKGELETYSNVIEFPMSIKDRFELQIKAVGQQASRSKSLWFSQSKKATGYSKLFNTTSGSTTEDISCNSVDVVDSNGARKTFDPNNVKRLPLRSTLSIMR